MIWFLLALSLGATPPADARDVGTLAELGLRDQYGREDSLRAHRGRVVLVTVIRARRLRKLRAWETALRERLEDVDYVRIADVPPDPPVTHEEVAEKLRERVPEDVSVLVDLEGEWARSLDLDTSQPNLLVFDREGRLVSSYTGSKNPYLEAYVTRDLERLLATDTP